MDIYWEHIIAGIKHSVAIECKNYNKNAGILAVRNFAREISDISGLNGLMVTKIGFSKDAIAEASADNTDLLTIREPADKDFAGRITEITGNIRIIQPSKIVVVSQFENGDVIFENGDVISA